MFTLISVWFTINYSKVGRFLNVLFIIGFILAELFATTQLRKMYIDSQVGKYGVITHGEIVRLYITYGSRWSKHKMATLAYRVNGQPVYREMRNSNKRLNQSDKVKVIYSSKNPEIFSILKIEKAVSDRASDEGKPTDPNKDLRGIPKPITFLDGPPEFKGGMQAFYAYLRANLIYPQTARDQRITGKVHISFVIAADGSVHDIKVEKGIGGGCDEAAIETVKNMPKWKQGMQNGKPVRVKYNIPISFSL